MTQHSATIQALLQRANERFTHHQNKVFSEASHAFAWLLQGQWVFGILLAVTLSPYAWEGKERAPHTHVWAAVILGGLLTGLPVYLARRSPESVLTRHCVAVAQMLWSALLIHLTGGRIETHFHVFGSLGFLAYYRDWKVLLTATVVVALDHFLRAAIWPESVYGVVNPEWWRFLEHAGWVLFCDAFLVLACIRGVREMRHTADREAEIEAAAESEWLKTSTLAREASPQGGPRPLSEAQ